MAIFCRSSIIVVGNQLTYGELEPVENHKMIKTCYNVLNLLMRDEV